MIYLQANIKKLEGCYKVMAEKNLQLEKNTEGGENVVNKLFKLGLSLLVLTKKQRDLSFGVGIPLFIAETKGIWKEDVAGGVVWFSLETSREKSQQMFSGYTTVLNQIFEIYAYKYGYFGKNIREGMGIFLEDNPHIQLVVIDSIEEIVKGEIEHMDHGHAYEILHDLKQAAVRFEVPILVVMHEEDYGDGRRWTEVSDAILRIEKNKPQDDREYTLCLKEKGTAESKLEIIFDFRSER